MTLVQQFVFETWWTAEGLIGMDLTAYELSSVYCSCIADNNSLCLISIWTSYVQPLVRYMDSSGPWEPRSRWAVLVLLTLLGIGGVA